MTHPQQQGFAPPQPQYGAPQMSGQPAYAPPAPQGYPGQQQPQYAQQQGAYPVAPQYGQPQYAPQQGAYPVAPPQYQQAPPAQLPSAPASLDGFYNQPSAGWGPAWQLGNAVQTGTSYIGVVAQWITPAHLEYPTQKNPLTGLEEVRRLKNGDPIITMKVPLNVAPDQRFTEGRAQFYVGLAQKDLLNAAIAAKGGDPTQPPPLGSMIRATKTGDRPNIHGGRSAIISVEYWTPAEAQQFAQQLGIAYPDLNTPRPAEPKHAAAEPTPPPAPVASGGETGGNFAPPPAQAGPGVQQQAALPQPPVQQAPGQVPAQFPQGGAPVAAQPPAGVPGVPAGGLNLPPAPAAAQPPAPPVVAPAPGVGSMPSNPAQADLMRQLTGQAPLAAPPAA